MQYNTQRVFHLNPYPGPLLHTGGKHSTREPFPRGRLLHGFPSTSFDILDDVSRRLPTFFLLLLNTLSEAIQDTQVTH